MRLRESNEDILVLLLRRAPGHSSTGGDGGGVGGGFVRAAGPAERSLVSALR